MSTQKKEAAETKKTELRTQATLKESLVLMAAVIAWLVVCVRSGASLAIPMLCTWAIIFGFCKIRSIDYGKVQTAMFDAIRSALGAILILLVVGVMVGTWIASGTIPAIIYVGLKLINPQVFLLCALIICSLLSLATGTSYGSAGSAGIAMMAIGEAMGIPVGMTAGAVLCGALFGDKLSPFSDTTNMAPAMAGGELFKHIKSMLYTTIPTYVISGVLFTILGLRYGSANYDPTLINETCEGIRASFNISPLTMIPVAVVIVLLMFKVDAVPAILLGGIAGLIAAIPLQGQNLVDMLGIAYNGFAIESGNELIDKLLNRGGITSMTSTAYVMIFAVGLGGALESLGVLRHLTDPVVSKIRSIPQLVGSTLIVSYACGMIGCTMAMDHVLTGKIMAPVYKEKGVAPEVLSRTMEDCGTVGAVLYPWHTSSIYFCGVLGVTYLQYLPYAFMSYLAPVAAMLCALTGFGIFYSNRELARKSFAKLPGEAKVPAEEKPVAGTV